jgi:phage gp29-like protein
MKKAPLRTGKPLTVAAHPDNKWRDNFNPRRHLTINRVVSLLESYTRGNYADLMWLLAAPFTGIESSCAPLLTIMERRASALARIDWDILTVSENSTRHDETLAAEQQDALRAAYERIRNLEDTILHLSDAFVRGFALAEPVREDGEVTGYSLVQPWNVIRDGTIGGWKYNPEALTTTYDTLPDEFAIDEQDWLVRTVRRPVGALALLCWWRMNITERNWDAAQEIFSVPSGIVILPQNIAPQEQDKYLKAAEAISRGSPGVLPAGAQYIPAQYPTQIVSLLKLRKEDLEKQLILAGTGGTVTSIPSATGMNSDVGKVQADVFDELAAKDARDISGLFQRRIDRDILDKYFPGRPVLAYFKIANPAADETDGYVERLAKLSAAGYQVDAAEVAEKTGMRVTIKTPPNLPSGGPGGGFAREAPEPSPQGGRKREEPASGDDDPDASALQNAAKPGARGADAPDPELAAELTGIFDGLALTMEKQMLKALPPPPKDTKIKNATVDANDDHHSEDNGKFVTKDGGGGGETGETGETKASTKGKKYDIKTISTPEEIGEFYDYANIGGKQVPHATRLLGKVSDARAEAIQAVIGRDVRGADHSIDTNAVRHGKNHIDPSRELSRGQLPLLRSDYLSIPEIIEKGIIQPGRSTGPNAEPRFIYVHKATTGRYHYVAEFRVGKKRGKRIAMVQMHKFKNRRAVHAFLGGLSFTPEACSLRVFDGGHSAK